MKYLYLIMLLMLFSCKKEKEKEKENIISNTVSIRGQKIAYYTSDKRVCVKNIEEKKIEYSKNIKSTFAFKPILINEETLITAFDINTLEVIDINRNIVKWKFKFKSKITDISCFNNKVIIANIKDYGIVALNFKGELLYHILYDYNICLSPDTSPYSISSSEELLFVSSLNCSTVSAYNINSGKLIWSFKEDFSVLSNVFYSNDKVFVTLNNYYKKGMILVLNSKSGKKIYEKECNIETRVKPVFYKDKLYYYTFFGNKKYSSIIEFNTNNFKDKVIYRMNKNNDISGRQIYRLNENIFFNDNELNLMELNLIHYNFNIIKKNVAHFNGVTISRKQTMIFY